MKVLVAALLAAVVSVSAEREAEDVGPALRAALPEVAQRASEALPMSAPARALAAPTRGVELADKLRIQRGRKIIFVPQVCRNGEGRYDLVVHFHGAPDAVEPQVPKLGFPAVFVLVNLGVGSGPYEDMFAHDGSLGRFLDEIDEVMNKECPSADGKRGRVALSAWSAGYGAAYRVLANPRDRELVDAVLLADGLHAGFKDKFRSQMNELQMAPFDGFAERAARGEKLFAITHTSIVTPSYASTTETSNYLIAKRGVAAEKVDEAGPRATMRLLSRANRGGFHVRGYAGNDTTAHCDHLYAWSDTLVPLLRERWKN